MGFFEKIAVAAALAAAILVPTLHSQVERSKVTSADSTAKELITTVNGWIADNATSGGAEKKPCELTIRMSGGDATVKDSNGKNDWNAIKPNCPDSLEERFESDYSGSTFTAKVFVDESGYAVYSWCVQNNADYSGDAPTRADFEAGEYEWKSENQVGTTKDGVIIGTCPHLFYKES